MGSRDYTEVFTLPRNCLTLRDEIEHGCPSGSDALQANLFSAGNVFAGLAVSRVVLPELNGAMSCSTNRLEPADPVRAVHLVSRLPATCV